MIELLADSKQSGHSQKQDTEEKLGLKYFKQNTRLLFYTWKESTKKKLKICSISLQYRLRHLRKWPLKEKSCAEPYILYPQGYLEIADLILLCKAQKD